MTADIGFDRAGFDLGYQIHGKWTPNYRLVSRQNGAPFPSPYNTAETPFLMPAAVEVFGGLLYIQSSSSSPPLYWKFTGQFFDRHGHVIVSKGYQGKAQHPFDFVACPVTGVLPPNSRDGAGYTPMDGTGRWIELFQPEDLELNEPVLMRLTLTAHSGFPQTPQNEIPDASPSDNVIEVWIQRGG